MLEESHLTNWQLSSCFFETQSRLSSTCLAGFVGSLLSCCFLFLRLDSVDHSFPYPSDVNCMKRTSVVFSPIRSWGPDRQCLVFEWHYWTVLRLEVISKLSIVPEPRTDHNKFYSWKTTFSLLNLLLFTWWRLRSTLHSRVRFRNRCPYLCSSTSVSYKFSFCPT